MVEGSNLLRMICTEVFGKRNETRPVKSHALRCASRRGREPSRLQKISCCANAAGLPVAM